MSATREFLANPAKIAEAAGGAVIRTHMECRDGFTMSVQYSRFHYCNARSFERGEAPLPEPVTVEIGFPTARHPRWLGPYAEDPKDLTGTVYGHVPLGLVDKVIAKHGGLK